jgi:hypothetical protein
MAEVTLGFDELEDEDLPLICMQCGSRKHVDFVERKFVRRPLFAPPGLIGLALTKHAHLAIPLCEEHGGPRLFAHQGRTWWGLQTIAIGPDRITIGRVDEEFAEALRKRREKRRRGETVEFEQPHRRVRAGRGPGGGMAAFKVLGIIAAVMVGLVLVMSCGMFGLMAFTTLWLPKAPPVSVGPPIPVTTAVEAPARPEGVVVALLAVAPGGGLPGAVPWTPLAQSARKETFRLLEDADLEKALVDLKSRNPGVVQQAAKRLAKATPEEARRKETALALEAALANPFPMAKEAAAEALGRWGTAENEPALLRMANDHNPSCRKAAASALAALQARR